MQPSPAAAAAAVVHPTAKKKAWREWSPRIGCARRHLPYPHHYQRRRAGPAAAAVAAPAASHQPSALLAPAPAPAPAAATPRAAVCPGAAATAWRQQSKRGDHSLSVRRTRQRSSRPVLTRTALLLLLLLLLLLRPLLADRWRHQRYSPRRARRFCHHRQLHRRVSSSSCRCQVVEPYPSCPSRGATAPLLPQPPPAAIAAAAAGWRNAAAPAAALAAPARQESYPPLPLGSVHR